MYSRGDKEFILDMFLSCKRILEYTKELSFEDFQKDNKTIDATIRNIEILGEAVKNISKNFQESLIYGVQEKKSNLQNLQKCAI